MRVMDRAMGGRSRYRALLGEKAGEAMGGGGPSAGLDGGEVGESVVDDEDRQITGVTGCCGEAKLEDVEVADYEVLRGASVAWVDALGAVYPVGEKLSPVGGREVFYSQ